MQTTDEKIEILTLAVEDLNTRVDKLQIFFEELIAMMVENGGQM
jgi:hypothetical protein